MTLAETVLILATVAVAALSHASFQLSTSVLTLISGHALSRKTNHLTLMKLIAAFVFGGFAATAILMSTVSFVFSNVYPSTTPLYIWSVATGVSMGVGLSIWIFYYRFNRQGTMLWIPRGFANFLSKRTRQTNHSAEAFSLGVTGTLSEIPFSFAPLAIGSLLLLRLDPGWQLAGVGLYAIIAILPLLTVGALIGGGHKLSTIQQWRESNKRFLQFVAGGILIVLGMYIYVDHVIATAALGGTSL